MSGMQKYFTAANATSVARALMVLPIVYLLNTWNGVLRDFPMWAIFWITLAIFSDYLDGWFARSYQEVSRLGKFIDPVADKIVIFGALFFARPISEAIPTWFIVFVVTRELIIFTCGYLVTRESKREVQANRTGKWSIFLTSLTFILVIFKLYPWAEYGLYATVLAGSASLYFYLKHYYQLYLVDVKHP